MSAAPGSMAWAIERGRAYRVDGIWRYGGVHCGEEIFTHADAARAAFRWPANASIWIAPGSVVVVRPVLNGSTIGGLILGLPVMFEFRNGQLTQITPQPDDVPQTFAEKRLEFLARQVKGGV